MAAIALAGCGRGTDPSPSPPSATIDTPADALTPPAQSTDLVAWRAFIGKAILAQTHDPDLHPYAFIIPPGDGADAVDQRKNIAMTIHVMLGRTAVPGNLLALTGADSAKVAEVIGAAFNDVPAHTARGLTVLYVGVPAAAAGAQQAVMTAGGELRVRAMRPSKPSP